MENKKMFETTTQNSPLPPKNGCFYLSELRVFCGIDQEQWDHVRPKTQDEAKALLLLQRW